MAAYPLTKGYIAFVVNETPFLPFLRGLFTNVTWGDVGNLLLLALAVAGVAGISWGIGSAITKRITSRSKPQPRRDAAALGIVGIPITGISLEVSLNPTTDQEGYSWLNLMVNNPNDHPVRDCYGKVRGYRAMSDQHSGHQFPRIGHGFPWQAWSGGGQYRTLAPGSSDLLSLVVARDDRIYTPDPQSRLNFPLPYDSYEAWIEVGSEGNDGIQPTLVTVGIFFDSDSGLRGELLPF